MSSVATISCDEILANYDVVLLDAYGVLVDDQGPLPGALDFVTELVRRDKPFQILTNSASRLPDGIASSLQGLGFPLEAGHILTSGLLLTGYFQEQSLFDAPCMVLGTEASLRYVEQAGGRVLSLAEASDAEVLVIADQAGFDCLQGMNRVLSLLLRRFDRGEEMRLLLCNPDLIYPMGSGRFGFTAGGLAAMLEALLRERYPGREPAFVRLRKAPWPSVSEALRRTGSGRAVMLGDQLATDILGAQRAGIDSVWVRTGLGASAVIQIAIQPTWQMPDLR